MANSWIIVFVVLVCSLALLSSCASTGGSPKAGERAEASASQERTPPPRIQAWMDTLTVDHAYDPETGFIVAREVISLPDVIAGGPPVAEAIEKSESGLRIVVVFATADRCAPCQQYKKSALNDPRVIRSLSDSAFLATHIEVDQEPGSAQQHLGSLGIPMTYAFRDGERVATLRGQRSAEELLNWLDELRD